MLLSATSPRLLPHPSSIRPTEVPWLLEDRAFVLYGLCGLGTTLEEVFHTFFILQNPLQFDLFGLHCIRCMYPCLGFPSWIWAGTRSPSETFAEGLQELTVCSKDAATLSVLLWSRSLKKCVSLVFLSPLVEPLYLIVKGLSDLSPESSHLPICT